MRLEPRWTFTIPSIHDDTLLSARIYHPQALTSPGAPTEKPWRKCGIAIAHPYAPMGGSYDDRIVGIVVEEFLTAGWIVGTFNFRGAHGANGKVGKTSWSGKPELADYQSFAGLFIHYMSYLQPNPPPDAAFTVEQPPISPPSTTHADQKSDEDEPPIVILAGYSYGSLILRHLPPILSILQPFATPLSGSAADEILLKAHKLADQSNLSFINTARDRDRERSRKRGHEHKLSVVLGGEEISREKRRTSREIRRSLETHRGHEIGSLLRSLSHARRRAKGEGGHPPVPTTTTRPAIQVPRVRYLLVSPLTPPTCTLAAPGLARVWNRAADEDATIKMHATLAIFGDQDMFASAKKLQAWVEKMMHDNPVGFSSVKIKGAGHFWHEEGVERQFRDALKVWGREVGVKE